MMLVRLNDLSLPFSFALEWVWFGNLTCPPQGHVDQPTKGLETSLDRFTFSSPLSLDMNLLNFLYNPLVEGKG